MDVVVVMVGISVVVEAVMVAEGILGMVAPVAIIFEVGAAVADAATTQAATEVATTAISTTAEETGATIARMVRGDGNMDCAT